MVQPLPPQQTVMVHGHKIAYYEAGKGSAVILLHGLGADSRHWAANIDALSQNFRVIALDQIGYGQSDKPLMRYTVENFADYLHGFLQAVKIPKASWWETRWVAGWRWTLPSGIRKWWRSWCWWMPRDCARPPP